MKKYAAYLIVLSLFFGLAEVLAERSEYTTQRGAITSPYKDLVVFGDSLSDPGNAYALLGTLSVPPYDLIPNAPYAFSGRHFSNGPTWIEQLARRLDLRLSVGPALQRPGLFSNYAVGSARVRTEGGYNLSDQIQLFLDDRGGFVSGRSLLVLFIGANDVRDAILAAQSDPSGATSQAIIRQAITAMRDNLLALSASGASQFLILNVPNLARLPAVRQQGSVAQTAAMQLSIAYNTQLALALSELEATLPVNFMTVDVFAALERVVANPTRVGLQDVVNSCITPDTLRGAECTQPDLYLFWDGIHPTRAGHAILARVAGRVLGRSALWDKNQNTDCDTNKNDDRSLHKDAEHCGAD